MKWEIKLMFDPLTRRAEIDIYDVIGDPWMGTTAYAVLYQLRQIDADELLVRINSVGGSVTDGMDIHNLLKEHPARLKTARVSGVAASIATVIALGCDVVEMHANSQWMIHEPYASFDFGSPPMRSEDLVRTASVLEKTSSQMLAIYATKTGKSTDEVLAACKAETWMTADEALAFGFVDRVIGVGEDASMLVAAAAWDAKVVGQFKRFPAPLARLAAQATRRTAPPTPAESEDDDEALTEPELEDMRTKLKAKSDEISKLVSDIDGIKAKLTAARLSAKSEDLKKLEDELDEMSKRAKTAESELEGLKKASEEYADAKSRAEDAEKQCEDLKKQMEELRAKKDKEDDDDDDDDDEDEDDDSEAKSSVRLASKRDLRVIARLAMTMTGEKSFARLAGALMALAVSKPTGPDAKEQHRARVSALVQKGRLPPHMKSMALKMTAVELDAFEQRLGTGRTPTDQHDPDPEAARRQQRLEDLDNVQLSELEKKIATQAGISLERALKAKVEDLRAARARSH